MQIHGGGHQLSLVQTGGVEHNLNGDDVVYEGPVMGLSRPMADMLMATRLSAIDRVMLNLMVLTVASERRLR